MSDSKPNAADAVIKMRDEFVMLVTAYNHVGLYTHARDAQRMAILLHRFVERHNLAPIAWPAVPVPPMTGHDGTQEVRYGSSILGANNTEISAEDL